MHSDQAITAAIRAGGRRREEMVRWLLKTWSGFGKKVGSKYHLTSIQEKDVFVDALMKLVQQIDNGTFKGSSKMSTYFYSILSNRAIDLLRFTTSNKNKSVEQLHEYTAIEEDAFELLGKKDQLRRIRYVIEGMGERCRAVLVDWGYSGYSMKEIMERHQLATVESARSTKYQCMKKLRVLLQKQKIYG